jgi:hypothetical protein
MKLGHPEFQKKYYNMLVINYLKKLTFLNAEVRGNTIAVKILFY